MDKNLGVELLGNVEFSFYYFEESPYSFLLLVAPNFSPVLLICSLFDGSRSKRCAVISHCGFDLHIPND